MEHPLPCKTSVLVLPVPAEACSSFQGGFWASGATFWPRGFPQLVLLVNLHSLVESHQCWS